MSSPACFGASLRPSVHPTSMALMSVLVVLSAMAMAAGVRQALVLIWNHTFMTQFYFWNVLSSSFVETSLIKLAVSLIGVVGLAPATEESLGHVGMLVMLLVVSLSSGLVTSAGIFFAYIVTRQEYLLDLELHGSFGLLAALSVAVAQQDPGGSFLPNDLAPWLQKRYFPVVLVVFSGLCRAWAIPVVAQDFPFVVVAAYVSWVYIRFFGHIVSGGPCGDVSDGFQLVMFFPPFLHRVLKPMCDFTYGVFLLLGFFKGRAARLPLPVVDGHGGVDPATVAILPPPEKKDPIAERRRARAMKLLDEKFAKLNAKPANRWDDDEDWEAAHGGKSKPASIGIDIGVAAGAAVSSSSSSAQVDKRPPSRLPSGGDEEDDWGMEDGGVDEEKQRFVPLSNR